MNYKLTNTGFKKISLSLFIILVIALLNIIVSSYIIQKNKTVATRMINTIHPYVEALEDFNLLITESKMYTTNWVYLQNSTTDKENLVKLHKENYPAARKKLEYFLNILKDSSQVTQLQSVFNRFESLLKDEKHIMSALVSFDDYENPTKKFTAEEQVESIILPATEEIQASLKKVIAQNRKEAQLLKDNMIISFNRLVITVVGTSVGLFLLVLLVAKYVSNAIRKPVLMMKKIVTSLGRGELPEETLPVSKDVVGEMVSAVNTLTHSFKKTSIFANEIGQGNLSVDFQLLSEKDMLGHALVNMRDSLKVYSENLEQKVEERTREVVEKNEKLEFAYKEIRDSITYAKRIQEAILPSKELISRAFPNSFIFYKPKDIVCGDFYWYADKADDIIVAAADCTGHGVPGALMTVIGNSLLNYIVNTANEFKPAEILNQLDKRLIDTFRKYGQANTNDGMDIALCHYNKKTRQLTFSGAKRPMYIFRKNGDEEVIKGDAFPIGSFHYESEKNFISHTLQLQEGDTIYIFSDGYPDQFGGGAGKKFMIKQFRELLTGIQSLPMDQQHDRLDIALNAWQKEQGQTDDILVIGIRF